MEENLNLYLLDSSKTTVGILSNRMPLSLPFFDDLQERDLDEMTDTLTLSVPANHKMSMHVIAGNYILYPTYEGGSKLYKIIETTETSDDTQYVKEVYAEVSAQDDLIKDVVRPTTFTSVTIDKVLEYILIGTAWTVGTVEDLGTQDVTISDYPTKLEALIAVVQQYGGELDYEYLTTGTTITEQNVSVFKQLGNATGKPFMHGKDIKGVERIEDRSTLITAMIGVGKTSEAGTPMSFKDATGVQNVPSNYQIVGDYIVSKDALENYSATGENIFGVYKDDSALSPQELIENTLAALQENDRPKMTYKADVALLEKLPAYEHERVALGDTILVQDKTVQPELYLTARIRKLSRSKTNPLNDAVELGDYIPVIPPNNERLYALQSKISEKEETWNKAEEVPALQEAISLLPTREDLFTAQAQRLKVRYVRDTINGSDVDSSNQWAELQVFKAGTNLAKGIVPTGSATLTNPAYLTDDKADSTLSVKAPSGSQYVQLDLGKVYEDIEYVKVWHNFDGGRTYKEHLVDVSEDGVTWVRLYNSTRHGSHSESASGFIVPVNSTAMLQSQQNAITQVVSAMEDVEEFKQSTVDELEQKVNQVDLNKTISDLNNAIADKVDAEYVNGQLVIKANAADVYKKEEVNTALEGKVSTTEYAADKTASETQFTSFETDLKQTKEAIELKAEKSTVETLQTAVEGKADAQSVSELSQKVSTSEGAIKANATAINERVKSTDYVTDKNGIVERLETAEGSIETQAGQIKLMATKSEVEGLSGTVSGHTSSIDLLETQIESKVEADEVKDIARRSGNEVVSFRYLRDIIETTETGQTNIWNQLVIMRSGVDIARGKVPTASSAVNTSYPLTNATDGSADSGARVTGTGRQWLQIDLGKVYDDVDYMQVWHYYADARTYKHEVQVSEDGVNWISLYDSEDNGSHMETSEGFMVLINAQKSVQHMASSIKQTADSIESKVEKNGVISTINQSAEGIRIKAELLAIEGALSITDFKYADQEVISQASNDASTALQNAANALSAAGTASSTASAAQTAANTAKTDASSAKSTASAASSTASAAKSTADAAATNATSAVSAANAAKSTADSAKTTATSAQSAASTASTNASAAVSTANAANTTAGTAKSTADSAKTTASAAQTAANAAKTTAEEAKKYTIDGNLYVKGVGNNRPSGATLKLNGNNVYTSHGRGLQLTVISRTDLTVAFNQTYDVYDTANNWAVHEALATKLDSLDDSVIIVMTSADAMQTNTRLETAMQRFGATGTRFGGSFHRVPYALVGIAGLGKGNGLEVYTSVDAAAPFAEIATKIVDGVPQGINTASTVIAQTAHEVANTAKSTADSASTTASTAKSTADTANSNANAAKTTASAAQSTANTASTNASNAVTAANTAKTDASSAKTTASAAQTTANTAKSTADTANTNANAAKTTASAAQTTANAVQSTVNTNKSIWDRATNIRSDGKVDVSKLYGTLSDSQLASASKWNKMGTYIDTTGVYTGAVVADQITGGTVSGILIEGSQIESKSTVNNQMYHAKFSGDEFRFVKFKAGVTNPNLVEPDLATVEQVARIHHEGFAAATTNNSLFLQIGMLLQQGKGQFSIIAEDILYGATGSTGHTFSGKVQALDGITADDFVETELLKGQYNDLNITSNVINLNGSVNFDRDVNLNNHNLANVNHLTFNDPGSNEGIEWLGGNGWKIVESPYGLTNAAGDLQITTNNDAPRLTITTDGSIHVQKNIFVRGTSNNYFTSQGTSVFKSDHADAKEGWWIKGDTAGGRIWSMDVYNRTYGSSPNMYVTSSGTLGRSTSASKYKLEIEEIDTTDLSEKVLELKPKSWYDKTATEQLAEYITAKEKDPNVDIDELDIPYLERHYGLIAEDLVEIGLGMYVLYGEPDSETGAREVEGIEYDRVWTLLIPIIKKQREQISQLESRLDALEARL